MNFRENYYIHNHSERVTSVFLKIVQQEKSVTTVNFFGNGDDFDFFKGLGRLFYVISPSETTFKDPKDVPSYFANVSIFCFS